MQSSLQDNMSQEAGMSFLADKQCQSHIKTSKMKHSSLQRENDQLNSQLNDLILKNREAERVIQEVSLVHLTFHSKCTNLIFIKTHVTVTIFFLCRKVKSWRRKLNTCSKLLTMK